MGNQKLVCKNCGYKNNLGAYVCGKCKKELGIKKEPNEDRES